jgi:hypothetical protein
MRAITNTMPAKIHWTIHLLMSRCREATRGCLEWTGNRTVPEGVGSYGLVRFRGRQWKAHRVAWTLARGEVPPGLCVLHKCDNPPCCNPDHLFLGTYGDNVRDAHRKGRGHRNPRGIPLPPERIVNFSRGERHYRAVLSEADVRFILANKGRIRQVDLAAKFGVTQGMVSSIHRGDSWKHIHR